MASKAIQKIASPPQDLAEVPKVTEVLSREEITARMRERWLPHLDELMTVQLNIALNDEKGKPGIDARKAIFDRLFGPVVDRPPEETKQAIVIQFNRVEGGNPEIQRLESSLSAGAIDTTDWRELDDLPAGDPPALPLPPGPSVELLLRTIPEAEDELVDIPPPDDPSPLPPDKPKGAGPGGKYARSPGHGFKDFKPKPRPKDKPSAPGVRSGS